ncbi:glycosyltransferase [Undibacterium amnicola]|uniref:Glycosyltransferase n=1 Tax=Undibacterium amnicola TaxID=1834038 RepID=A0ABR6XRZ2_9BURK|nr:glycosyltransferase [Undibacterium amnicola]MBC3832242.1 glycosyltransferase [Undibacterium amnicola]
MRLLIDLQACQSTGSRDRGIGRYSLSLAKAMLANAGEHDCHLLLSGLFPETVANLREAFAHDVPVKNIHVWQAAKPVAEILPGNMWRCRAAEFVREQALAELRPDMVHVSSLFEGSGDDAVTSIGVNGNHLPTAVTLYDLIPLVYENQYLTNVPFKNWYYRKLLSAKRADLLLAISEASRQEGIEFLHLVPEKVVNISSAVDAQFQARNKSHISDASMLAMRQRYGLSKPYVMYTGGIDLRKNIDGLIIAYAALPSEIRQQHQLAIVCSVRADDRQRLMKLARQHGLTEQDLILTGFVPDHDLPLLYQECKLFVFPSWHEGFGLPALEAMSCGAPVIAANCSSLPEVLACDDALFDPRDRSSITNKMAQALSNPEFLRFLSEHGVQRSKHFSWDASGKKAIAALEDLHARRQDPQRIFLSGSPIDPPITKLRCAYVSPLPALPSGIADYSAELIPALAEYYDLTLIVSQDQVDNAWLRAGFPIKDADWFVQYRTKFDRVIYHFGNSPAHLYMYDLFEKIPGTIVLHDFFLGDALAYAEMNGMAAGIWTKMLYKAHGYQALLAQRDEVKHPDLIRQFPCSPALTHAADGVIVHSEYSCTLAKQWQGSQVADQWKIIPHLRELPQRIDKEQARQRLGLEDDSFLVCSFGMLGPSKLNKELLAAWNASDLSRRENCFLIFVGQNDEANYGREFQALVNASRFPQRIKITGFADIGLYRTYLQAADTAVQLRTQSRGETSGTVIDCMAYGLPLIYNQHGTMAEIPEGLAWGLEDQFTVQELQNALELILSDQHLRLRLRSAGYAYIAETRQPAQIAMRYWEAIEGQAKKNANALMHITVRNIAEIDEPILEAQDITDTASALAQNKKRISLSVVYVLVTASDTDAFDLDQETQLLVEKLLLQETNWRFEFVRLSLTGLRYAWRWAWRNFGLRAASLEDDLVKLEAGDFLLAAINNKQNHIQFSDLCKYQGVIVLSDQSALDASGIYSPAMTQLLGLFQI